MAKMWISVELTVDIETNSVETGSLDKSVILDILRNIDSSDITDAWGEWAKED